MKTLIINGDDMTKVVIPYFSASGFTQQIALAIAETVDQHNFAKAVLMQVKPEHITKGRYTNDSALSDLTSADAIIFGSPTYMGGVASQYKSFIDATSEIWTSQALAGKLAAGFTCGSAPNGDQSSTLQYLTLLACQQGMIWISLDKAHGYSNKLNRLGSQLGCVAHIENNQLNESDLNTARYLAARVVQYTNRLKKSPSETN